MPRSACALRIFFDVIAASSAACQPPERGRFHDGSRAAPPWCGWPPNGRALLHAGAAEARENAGRAAGASPSSRIARRRENRDRAATWTDVPATAQPGATAGKKGRFAAHFIAHARRAAPLRRHAGTAVAMKKPGARCRHACRTGTKKRERKTMKKSAPAAGASALALGALASPSR
ncbi:hypothetical protein [Cupriavidus sp. WS]|uniref:hypothetical protein n=1 Tax=Cupriavidus sp. WS TaxID=1312922 RepID=UPI0012DC24A0|nr:hypothetical protein [Cupriavidus sp. WS]